MIKSNLNYKLKTFFYYFTSHKTKLIVFAWRSRLFTALFIRLISFFIIRFIHSFMAGSLKNFSLQVCMSLINSKKTSSMLMFSLALTSKNGIFMSLAYSSWSLVLTIRLVRSHLLPTSTIGMVSLSPQLFLTSSIQLFVCTNDSPLVTS